MAMCPSKVNTKSDDPDSFVPAQRSVTWGKEVVDKNCNTGKVYAECLKQDRVTALVLVRRVGGVCIALRT